MVRKIPYRASLPLVFGPIAVALMAWGVHADQQCIFYDAGRPFWPCEAPNFILGSLNAPAVALAQPLANVWRAAPSYFVHVIELPLVLLWWWFLGTRLDFGLLGIGAYRHRRAWIGVLAAALVAFLALLGDWIWQDILFQRAYPYLKETRYLALLRLLKEAPVCLWLVASTSALSVATFRIARGTTGHAGQKLASPRVKRLALLGLAVYCVSSAGLFWHVRSVERRRQAEYDLRSLIVMGRVVDDRGLPVEAIEVSLVPLLDDSDAHSQQAVQEFTDENGEYILRPEATGRYFLSVSWNAPPSTKRPFLTRYYPDASDRSHAEILELTAARHLSLAPIRLNRLELVKVPVSVSWSNDKPEPDAYMFFTNTLYLNYGSIGNEALYPDEDGTVSLPVGFEYRASAQVNCDGGKTIDNEYTPKLTFSTKSTDIPVGPQHFVLPGNPCQIWHSK
jgi:hypothetical protein